MEHQTDDDIATLSVTALKALITSAGLSYAGCVEKSDLRERAAEARATGPAVACSYFDLQKTGGAKFVSLLISGIPDTPAVRAVSPEMFAGLQISET